MQDFRAVGASLSNWGRWGPEDERGTLNLVTQDTIARAATLARHGRVFSLAIPFDEKGPQDGTIRNNPLRVMTETGLEPQRYPGAFRYADDYVVMALQAATQWDSLAHVHYDGQMYNGFPASSISVHGTTRNAVTNLLPAVVTRAVLVDVAGHRGVPWLDLGEPIGPDELDEVLRAQGSEVGEGDVVLVRTGWRAKFTADGDRSAFKAGEPGLTLDCAAWCHERGVAAVGSDNYAVEVLPGQIEGEALPFHMVALRDMGMPLAEILDLEQFAADCADDGVFEAFLCAAPLPFTAAVGSPVNPIVIK